MIAPVVIVDLDGTICNCSHREHLAQAKLWDEFHAALPADTPNQAEVEFVRCMSAAGYIIVAVTGRPELWRTMTMSWMDAHMVPIDVLIMRPDKDFTPDHELKIRMVGNLTPDKVLMVLDDRDKVVDAWRAAGYRCWQVQPGGY